MDQQNQVLKSAQGEIAELKDKQSRALGQIDNLSGQLASAKTEAIEASRAASEARETLAKVNGKLEAATAQNAALLAAIGEKKDGKK